MRLGTPSFRSFCISKTQARGALVILASIVTFSCILADPPADLPQYPPVRPSIVKASVLPPADKVVMPPLPTFLVPVELVDTNATFAWNVFVDFDPITNPLPVAGEIVTPEPGTIDGGVRTISFSISGVPSASRCHTIEVVVARSFSNASPHTPNAPGGDSVSWFYNPSGSIDGCPTYDAGAFDASPIVDASIDAAKDAGVQ